MYLLKEAFSVKEKEEDDSHSKVIKALKVGEIKELLPGGANIPVTLQNVEEYIKLTKHQIYRSVIDSVSKQAAAFVAGFKDVIGPIIKYLRIFSAEELRKLAEGSNGISCTLFDM